MKTLIWTRSLADWSSDQPLLAALLPQDVAVEHIPCVTLSPVATHLTQDGPWTHIVFTSPHAVEFALKDEALKHIIYKCGRIYTHGTTTEAALAQVGLTAHRVEGLRTAEALGAWLDAHLPRDARILIPGAKEPAFNMAFFFAAKGRTAAAVACYETLALAHEADGGPLTPDTLTMIKARPEQVVCFASPSAVKGFVLGVHGLDIKAAVIGPTTAAAAKPYFSSLTVAPANTLEALIETAWAALSPT